MRAEPKRVAMRSATAAGALAVIIGGGHFVAWVCGWMPQGPSDTITMKTNTGLGLLLCGLSLILLARGDPKDGFKRRTAQLCAAIVIALGLTTLSEHIFGWDAGIDQLLATESGAPATVSPNRIGPPASASFVLLGSALLLLSRYRASGLGRSLHQPLAVIVALLGLLSIIGYLYGASALYDIARLTYIAWPTALSLFILGVGLLCADPDAGLMARVTADDPGGAIVRTLLSLMVFLPLLLGWVRLTGERRHWFDAAMGTSLMMLLFIVIFCSLLLFAGRRVGAATVALRDAEHETRGQKDLLAVTLASIGDAVIVTDAAGKVTFVNAAAEQLTGWTRTDALGKRLGDVFSIVNEETRARVENPVEKVLRLGEVIGLGNHTVLIAKDGRETPIDNSGAPIRTADGEVKGVVLVFRDMTERRRAEDALRRATERERFLADVVENASNPFGVGTPDGRLTHFNRAFLELTGYSREDLERSVNWAIDLTPPEWRQIEAETLGEAVRRGESVRYEKEYLRKDGSRVPVELFVQPVFAEDGTLLHYRSFLADITERKRAEDERRESEENYRQLFEGMLEGCAYCLMLFDDDRRPTDFIYLDVNDAFARLTGLEGVVGKRVTEVIPGIRDANPEVFEIYGRVVEDGKPERFETYLPGLDRWLSISVYSPRKDHFVAVFDNITARKRAEEEIREANVRLIDADRGKNEFLAVLSHELRNPLAAVRTAVHLLEHVPPGGEHANQARSVIDRQTVQLTRLVDDLLDVTRISRGKIQIQVEPVELTGLVRRTAEDHRALFAKGGIEFEHYVPDEPLWVDGDAQRLAQAVGNLLHNAAKFTDRGGRTVTLVRKDDQGPEAVVVVRDTGIGISAQALPHLFQPFMQAENTLDRVRGGLGLGLALVKSLVEMHGGTVSARSAGVGLGSEFTLRLPLRSAPVVVTVVADSTPPPRRRVLIIEDNVDAADSLRHALALAGHQVEVAYDGPDGVQKARDFAPEIVLCDVGLPGLNGYDVARTLRNDAALASVRLVALTGYALPDDVAKAHEAGFDLHVAKPASPERLRDALR